MALESDVMRSVQIWATKRGARLFRNNVAFAWIGNTIKFSEPGSVRVNPGDVVIRSARPLHAGLCEGSSDLIGWTARTVTPDMVGQTLAVFTAIEVKSNTGRVSEKQSDFLAAVKSSGGVAGVVRTETDLTEAMK